MIVPRIDREPLRHIRRQPSCVQAKTLTAKLWTWCMCACPYSQPIRANDRVPRRLAGTCARARARE